MLWARKEDNLRPKQKKTSWNRAGSGTHWLSSNCFNSLMRTAVAETSQHIPQVWCVHCPQNREWTVKILFLKLGESSSSCLVCCRSEMLFYGVGSSTFVTVRWSWGTIIWVRWRGELITQHCPSSVCNWLTSFILTNNKFLTVNKVQPINDK